MILVGVFAGGVALGWGDGIDHWPGLITFLAVIAGVVLLFRGRYPSDIFEVVIGLNRWAWRVVAYGALMRDEYPPFRLAR